MTDDTVEAVEFFAPAVVLLGGHSILEEPLESSRYLLSELDANLTIDADEVISNMLGIAIFSPGSNDDPMRIPVSVLVCKKEYFSQP